MRWSLSGTGFAEVSKATSFLQKWYAAKGKGRTKVNLPQGIPYNTCLCNQLPQGIPNQVGRSYYLPHGIRSRRSMSQCLVNVQWDTSWRLTYLQYTKTRQRDEVCESHGTWLCIDSASRNFVSLALSSQLCESAGATMGEYWDLWINPICAQ